MDRKSTLVTLVDGGASIVVDTSAWPIVVATWFGEPTEGLVDQYFAQHKTSLDRAVASGDRLILITDTFATERPSPKARKRIVDLTEAQGEVATQVTLRSFVVIESAIMRGVVTALSWVYPKMAESENVASLEMAFQRSIEVLRAEGRRVPDVVPAQRKRPARPSAA